MFHGTGGVLPGNVITVRLSHHTGVVAATTVGNEGLVDFVNLVVVLCRRQLVGHLLEDGIALCVHAEGVVIDGFGIEQIIPDGFVGRAGGQNLHFIELLFGVLTLLELQVHLHTLLCREVEQAGFFVVSQLLVGLNGLINTA